MNEPGLRVAEQFETPEQQIRADVAGMWVFLATEVLLFGGAFVAFTVYRAHYSEVFAAASGHLRLVLGGINTVILLTSGVTMSLVDPAMEEDNRRRALQLLAVVILLGLGFLGLKGYEYWLDFSDRLVPFAGFPYGYTGPDPGVAKIFFRFYFILTGLHALHMSVGIVVLAVMFVLASRWRDSGRLTRCLRIAGMYWAFVDIVWIFIYPTLYLLN